MTRTEDEVAWRPHGYYRTGSQVARFMAKYDYDDYEQLRPDSEAELATFWERAAEDIGIVWETPYDTVLDVSEGPAFAQWFVGGELNATATLIDRWVEQTPDKTAYIWESERGDQRRLTYQELQARTNQVANALRASGVGEDDVVGIVFPLHPNAMIAALACMKIGTVQTHVFPGYGARAIRERLADCQAHTVFTADGYYRNGKTIDLQSKVDEAVAEVDSVEQVVRYDNCGLDAGSTERPTISWQEFTAGQPDRADATIVGAEDPALIAYTSGTTGTPKGTIQTQASLLVSGAKEAKYQYDVGQDDVYLWVTDFGWIVVPIWLLGGSQCLGATTVLLGGGLMHPQADRIWDLVERHGITILGMSPTGTRQLMEATPTPRETHDLSTLKILGSTGEPWDVESWSWYLDAVGDGHLPIINESGGTETCGALLGVTPLTPLKPGTLYGPAPGIPANVYDEEGTPSQAGYLVIEGPVPGMTRSLTGGDERYLDEYWRDFEGVWNHDDWVEIDDDGFWFVRGRADDTMNISGRRITAPTMEAVIEEHPAIEDVAVVSVSDPVKGAVPVGFATVADANADAATLLGEVNELITEDIGPMFRLERLHLVTGFPRTQTGKLARKAIRGVYVGEAPRNPATLQDADVLETYPRRDESAE